MLSRFDDYPIHQTAEPIAHPATSDRNVYDRYWFNGYSDDGEFYFGIGSAIYPNLGIMDGAFSIVRGGEQHSVFASRRAPSDPTDTVMGPLRIDVIEPMRRIRVTVDENETGITCDLTFTARTACIEEGRQTRRTNGRLVMDTTRFAQFGRWQGWFRYGGEKVDVDATRVFGTKDRSWGLRPIGPADPAGAPPLEMGAQVFFLWAPIHWEDRCTHFGCFEDGDAHMWHTDGAIVPAYEDPDAIPGVEEPRIITMTRVEHEIDYLPGTRRAGRASIALVEKAGARHEIDLEPLLCFRMKGIGYMHPTRGHGHWQGEVSVAGDSFKCDEIDPMGFENQHIQQVVRARMGDQTGIGVLEQICFGPHSRYGFKEILDPA